ncbi:MAG: hypothetical protein ABI761_05540 [Saprospiraceae bacterium]
MNKEKLILIALGQAIFYSLIWLMSDYVGLILCLSISLISFAIWIISWISDRLEYANVAFWYYPLMIMSTIIPLIIIALFWYLKAGEMDWMKPIF